MPAANSDLVPEDLEPECLALQNSLNMTTNLRKLSLFLSIMNDSRQRNDLTGTSQFSVKYTVRAAQRQKRKNTVKVMKLT